MTLWTTLQSLGRELIVERLLTAFESCRLLYDIISKCNGCRILVKYFIQIYMLIFFKKTLYNRYIFFCRVSHLALEVNLLLQY